MDAIITEKQMELFVNFQIMESKKIEFQETYNNYSNEQKEMFVEIFETFYPEHKGKINEATGWNTLGDILGIVDPTPTIDIINGLSYLYQGDYFFGMLSLIAAIPLIGDALTKGFMIGGKGTKVIKLTDGALKLAKDARKVAEATQIIADIAKSDSLMAKLLSKVRQWAPKLKNLIDKIPLGRLGQGFKNTLKDWITLFEKAGAGSAKASGIAKQALKNPMTREETVNVLKQIRNAAKEDKRLFRDFGGDAAKGLQGLKNYKASGMPRLFGNKATRSLMRRTKFWAGFLDYLGIGNFVGPDDLKAKMPDFDEKMNQYSQTKQAKQNWDDDFANIPTEPSPNMGPEQPETSGGQEQGTDFGKDFLTNLVFGPITGNIVA